MKNKLKNIYKYSQNLFHTLRNTLGDDISHELDRSFLSAINNGGLEELDFKRPEGQSYNPRPARIAIILITETLKRDDAILLAAFSASVFDTSNSIAATALEICGDSHTINYHPTSEAKFLALALHLDRARHFHLSPDYLDKNSRAKFHALTYKVINSAGPECKRLNDLLIHWLRRDEKKLTS